MEREDGEDASQIVLHLSR